MGRDITLYPKKASRKELSDYLKNLGFVRCAHLWDWPKGTLNYSWFDDEDFRSIDGVSADVYPIDEAEKAITGNEWALHVRNLYSASWHDVRMLNDVLRGARKKFGGTIKGDYGTNRYAPLWNDESSPMSRGISAIYQRAIQEIGAIKFSLPDPSIHTDLSTGVKMRGELDFMLNDPSRVIYNGLVPFAVSMFEYFFSQVFQVLIAYDKFALDKRNSYRLKVEFDTLLELNGKARTIESIIAGGYAFQNLNQLNKAFKEWLGIDVRNILYKKKKIGDSIRFLENRVSEIIQRRHGIVHHFEIDRTLTKQGYIHILEAIEKSMAEFVSFAEKKYGIKIEKR